MQEGRHKKTSLEKYSPLTLLQGFERLACERMLETERKLHILTPLLWLSRCVFIFLLMLGSTPSGLSLVWCGLPYHISSLLSGSLLATASGVFRVPSRSGVAFPTTSRLYCLEICWQLHRGFSECPIGRVWPSLPHLVSNPLGVWDPNSTELDNNSTPTRSPTGSLNRMFNRHQAEITVMQFRGYSLS